MTSPPANNRWRGEGFPEGRTVEEFFGYEMYEFGFDASLQLPPQVLAETDEYVLSRSSDGAVAKSWKRATSTPGWEDFLIKDSRTWEEYKPRLRMNDSRVDWGTGLAGCREARQKGLWIRLVAATGYGRVQGLVGSERLLTAMLDDPAWVKDLFSTVAGLLINVTEEMLARGFQFEGVVFCQDMGYRNASLFSPAVYRELCLPVDRRLCGFFRASGIKVMLHSCGDVRALVPGIIEAGFDSLEPLEVKAGMDLVALKRDFGEHLCFMGGIDVRAMANPDPRAIEYEISRKIPAAMVGGGYIYHSDHSVPDDVSFAQYQRALALVRKYGCYGG